VSTQLTVAATILAFAAAMLLSVLVGIGLRRLDEHRQARRRAAEATQLRTADAAAGAPLLSAVVAALVAQDATARLRLNVRLLRALARAHGRTIEAEAVRWVKL